MVQDRLLVYNASAGSGKTFQIAKEYLQKILLSKDKFYIDKLIGITFTNKAAGEMKRRIINNLIQASQGEIKDVMLAVATDIRPEIEAQTGALDDDAYRDEILNRSKKRLKELLHRYDAFQLTTIDKMMYKIIRTFARDMQLPADVEVAMDYKEIISNLIDKLINQARQGEHLTDFLIDFAKRKTDDGKVWDIKTDLLAITDIIYNDNYYDEINSIADKSFADFKALRSNLYAKRKQLQKDFLDQFQQIACEIQQKNEAALTKAFSDKLALICRKDFTFSSLSFTVKQLENIEGEAVFVKKKYQDEYYQDLNRQIQSIFLDAINKLDKFRLYTALLKQINVLSIQSELLSEIADYKHDNRTIFINDFNKLILEQILKDLATDTPYIYMRLGEKFAHYFVDEFQDTSQLQWQNLIPLIKEALSKEFDNGDLGSAMIVGDAKQSIYRFRGGRPEQFIALTDTEHKEGTGNPFAGLSNKKVMQLPYNWRSRPNVIRFNNLFFKTFPDFLDSKYKNVYAHPEQDIPGADTDEGFVQIRFLKNKNDNGGEKEDFTQAVLDAVNQALDNGFAYEEICVLSHTKNEGIAISERLLENDIEVVSSETLLLSNAGKIDFLIHWFRFLHFNSDIDFFDILRFISRRDNLPNEAFYREMNIAGNTQKTQRIAKLADFGYELDYERLMSFNNYDLTVYLVDKFGLQNDAVEQAYLQAFMEEIYNFSQKNSGDIFEFLQHWDIVSDTLSISMSEHAGAVKMMTVHASKGLEFPVVIYYTKGKILSSKDAENSVWIPVDPATFSGFEYLPVMMKDIKDSHNPLYQHIYHATSEEKKFDNINRLYVALTRAIDQLYIILDPLAKTPKDVDVNNIFDMFLQKSGFVNDGNVYQYGNPKRFKKEAKQLNNTLQLANLYYKNWQLTDDDILKINTVNFDNWQEDKKNAIQHGILLHDILSEITTQSYWNKNQAKLLASIPESDRQTVQQTIEMLLQHTDLKSYFSEDYQVLNERSILIPDKNLHFTQKRPDRLLLRDNQISILDYKTGEKHSYHRNQLEEYSQILSSMGYEIGDKILIYIGKDIEVVRV